VPVAEAVARLERATGTEHHVFWPCDLSLLDGERIDRRRLHGPRQVTDAYLLALAVVNEARLATLDRAVSLAAVVGARAEHLVVI
jgi:predicted nucleic acid-binding protein